MSIGNRFLGFLMKPITRGAILALLVLLAVLIAGFKNPLQEVHWDVPIYLYQSKRFADTHYLLNYMQHAAQIAAQVGGRLPPGEWYSESFWHFARLGNTVILGAATTIFGSTLGAITASTWAYNVFLVAALGCCIAIVILLGEILDPGKPWFGASAISVVLFLLSDVFHYLAGNLVGEVPCLFFLSTSIVAALVSLEKKRNSLAVLSGVLAFLSYTVRFDSIWLWLSFFVVYVLQHPSRQYRLIPWTQLLFALITAFILFLAYAAIFWPLVDPAYFVKFAVGLGRNSPGGVPAYKLLFVASGLLWIGALLSLRWFRQSRLIRFGGWWFLVGGMPWSLEIILGGPSQTRMFALFVPPMFILSAGGWALALQRAPPKLKHTLIGITVSIVALSQPIIYGRLHRLPGGWRLQYPAAFLYVPRYESLSYWPNEIKALSEVVYGSHQPTILIESADVSQEYFDLLRFFGPTYGKHADLAMVGDPTNRKPCDDASPSSTEPVYFCSGRVDRKLANVTKARFRILEFLKRTDRVIAGATPVAQTKHFLIDRI